MRTELKRSDLIRRIEAGGSYSGFAITSMAMGVLLVVVVLLNIWLSFG